LIAGNWLSLLFPRQLEFGNLRKHVSQLNLLLGLIAQVAVMGVVAGVYVQTRAVAAGWADSLAGVVCMGFSVGTWFAYRASLNHVARFAYERRENLTAALCR
jgi:hypothetical protein